MKKEQYELTQAQQEWVLQNTGLVYYIVNRYNNYSWQREDLEQIGMLGLCKAAATFDESKGVKFGTYAARCIDNEIKMFLRANRNNFNLPHLEDVLKTDSNGSELTIADIVEDKNVSSFTEDASREKLEKILSIILNRLSHRECCIMLWTAAGALQKEIGNRLKISQSYASRVITKCLRKIRCYENKNEPYQEKFEVKVQEEEILITFSTKGIANLQEFHSRFLASAENIRDKLIFNITYQKEKAIFEIILDEMAFEYIAVLMVELNKSQGKCEEIPAQTQRKEKVVINKAVSKKQNRQIPTQMTTTDRQIPAQMPTTDRQTKQVKVSQNQTKAKETVPSEVSKKDKNVANQTTDVPNQTTDVANENTNVAKLNELAIQNYAIELQRFSLWQIREKFSSSSILEIAIAINGLLRKNIICVCQRGIYQVN